MRLQGIEGHSAIKFHTATEADYDEITEVWEASVRETHDFLSESDIAFYKPLIRQKLLAQCNVVYTRADSGEISGFMAVKGDKIEMIFMSPKHMGKGLGKRLFWYGVMEMKAHRLDVNEQNQNAVNFYMRLGCKVIGRSQLDEQGRPFPLLHLECIHAD